MVRAGSMEQHVLNLIYVIGQLLAIQTTKRYLDTPYMVAGYVPIAFLMFTTVIGADGKLYRTV